jgi:serine/threonine-protein kinase
VPPPKSPDIAIPITEEEFNKRRRRILQAVVAGALVLVLIGYFAYRHFTDPIRAREAFDEAQRFANITRYSQAILACSSAIARKPDYADAYYLRAQAYASQRNLEEAESDYAKVIQLDSKHARGYSGRCAVRLEFKDYQGAVADCSKAIELDPKNSRALNQRGIAYRYLKNLPASLDDLDKAVSLSPEVDNLFQRATTLRDLNQFQKAIADFDQAVYLFPGNPEVLRARAEAKMAMGDLKGAKEDYQVGRQIEGR